MGTGLLLLALSGVGLLRPVHNISYTVLSPIESVLQGVAQPIADVVSNYSDVHELTGAPSGSIPLLWGSDGWIYMLGGLELWRIRPDGGDAQLYGALPQECVWWEQPTMDNRARRLVCTVMNTESDIWAGTNFDAEE